MKLLNRKKAKMDLDEVYRNSLKGKQIPILILDSGWHELFPNHRKNHEIKELEKTLNRLIKKQGKNNDDVVSYKKAKTKIRDNIMANMTDGHEADSTIRSKKQEKNQKLLCELNQKIEEAEDLQHELPKKIRETNQELLIACMKVCYQELMDNTQDIIACEEQIAQLREELKNTILKKQDCEMRNTQVYKYMHNLLGGEVVEIFDREHAVWKGNIEETKVEE